MLQEILENNSSCEYFLTPSEEFILNKAIGWLRTCQVSKMELFTKINNGFQQLTILPQSSILDIWICLSVPLLEVT